MLPMNLRPLLQLKIIKQLGAGTDAVVYKSLSSPTGYTAIKVNKPGKYQNLKSEIEILKTLDHPNIVKMINYRINTKTQPNEFQIELEMEFMNDSLYNHFAEFYYNSEYPTRENFLDYRLKLIQISRLCEHIGAALVYLHDEQKILHGDIKSNNIMTNRFLTQFKLIDFGNSVRLPKGVGRRSEYVGSAAYMPPECEVDELDEDEDEEDEDLITFAADIYAFGCVLYECISGTHFNDTQLSLASNEMLNGRDRRKIYPKVITLIDGCLQTNPNNRPNASEIELFQATDMRNEYLYPQFLK